MVGQKQGTIVLVTDRSSLLSDTLDAMIFSKKPGGRFLVKTKVFINSKCCEEGSMIHIVNTRLLRLIMFINLLLFLLTKTPLFVVTEASDWIS